MIHANMIISCFFLMRIYIYVCMYMSLMVGDEDRHVYVIHVLYCFIIPPPN